jgi:YD repeat-containing protein
LITVTASDLYGATASGSFGLSITVKAGGFLTTSTPSLAPKTTQALAAVAAEADVLSAWRPASTDGLHSYQYYDSQGRVVGSVNEQGFSETVYDAEANKQHTRALSERGGGSAVGHAGDPADESRQRQADHDDRV